MICLYQSFVHIADAGHYDTVTDYLKRYGFKEVISNAFETTSISEKALTRLKRDIDKSTDFYDKIRFYQYPIEGTMVISFLKEKKWKKSVIRT